LLCEVIKAIKPECSKNPPLEGKEAGLGSVGLAWLRLRLKKI